MKKVVIYGMGHDYRENYDFIRSLERSGVIEILAVSDKAVEQECEIEGLRIVPPERVPSMPFDYVFVASKAYYSEIVGELVNARNILRAQILPLSLFMMPNMTFGLYEQLCEKRLSILCNNCFGGLLSNRFGLEHRSPLKNLFLIERDFIRFASNAKHYLSQEPVLDRWNQGRTIFDESRYPVLRLDDIRLYCNHDTDPDAAIAKYMHGAAKVNTDSLVLIMITDKEEMEREFHERPFDCPRLCISSLENHSPKTLHIEADNQIDLLYKAFALPDDPSYFDFFIRLLMGYEEFVY